MSLLSRLFSGKRQTENKQEAVPGIVVDSDALPLESEVMIDLIAEKSNIVSIVILLSYIRHYINTGKKGDILVKIGYNKPPAAPFNFALDDELVDDIYPGTEIEIN